MRYIEHHEKRVHGTQSFPFAFYHVNSSHPRYVMAYYWHSESELIRVLSGTLAVTLEEEEIHLKAGDSLYIPSGMLHGGIPKDCNYECLVFDMTSLLTQMHMGREVLQPLIQDKISIQRYFPAKCIGIKRSVEMIFRAMEGRGEGFQLRVLGGFYCFLGEIFKEKYYSKTEEDSDLHKKRIQQYKDVLTYIASHYAEKITLEDMAACVHLNSRYFCRIFRELTHQSPMEYLNSYRIEAACEQLSYTDKSITEVAFDCGYRDAGYFVKVFKKIKGMTPSQYLHNIL